MKTDVPKVATPQPVEVQQVEQPQPRRSEPKQVWRVVKELPVQVVRRIRDEDGTIVNLITIDEYLTAQANQED